MEPPTVRDTHVSMELRSVVKMDGASNLYGEKNKEGCAVTRANMRVPAHVSCLGKKR